MILDPYLTETDKQAQIPPKMTSEDGFLLMDTNEFASYLASFKFARPVLRVQNHHTWKPGYAHFTGGNHFSLLRSMRRSHMQDRGWADIGQNITTFSDGKVAICRPLNTVPACIKGANTGSIGVEHLGNFDLNGDQMTPEHREAIVRTNAILCKKLQLVANTDSIVYHHWYDLNSGKRTNGTGVTKSCPGTNFFGGNSVENATAGFIPEIVRVMDDLQGQAVVPTASIRSGRVLVDSLNVRDRPNIAGAILRKLNKADNVDVFAKADPYGGMAWLKISPDLDEWVAEKFISQ